MFSEKQVRKLAAEFVCVNIDPKDSQDAMELKSTRFVPEIVFLTSDTRVVARLDSNERTPYGMAGMMERVLKKVKGKK